MSDAIMVEPVDGSNGGYLVTLSCGHKLATREKRVSYDCNLCQAPTAQDKNCAHLNFMADVDVNRVTDDKGNVQRFNADVRIKCSDCGLQFRFIGLPAGLDLNGAAVSVDGQEARLAIAPKGEVVSVLEGAPQGFTVKKSV